MEFRVLVTGSDGQLGWELRRQVPANATTLWTDVDQLDITSAAAVENMAHEFKPNIVINAAAYTAVDKAESDAKLAYRINRDGAMHLAKVAAKLGAKMLHVSTDFVFDGKGEPYQPLDGIKPLSVYGASKAEGEQAVLAANAQALIVRTAWVYSSHGGNFVKTMLRLMSEKPSLNVICDQIGSPTWAKGLASVLWQLAAMPKMPAGIGHYTDSGVASWYDYAVAIQEEALALGLLKEMIPIHPIPTSAYPTPAKRPGFSVLDKGQLALLIGTAPHWRVQLRAMLAELKLQT
jgi:dTDP-4-dehydrorhamnose reductase